jgi:hypothetical protein
MKFRPVGAEVFHGGATDMTKLVIAFRTFPNAPKNGETGFDIGSLFYLTNIFCHFRPLF